MSYLNAAGASMKHSPFAYAAPSAIEYKNAMAININTRSREANELSARAKKRETNAIALSLNLITSPLNYMQSAEAISKKDARIMSSTG